MVSKTGRSILDLVDYEKGTMSAEIFSSREIYEQELEQVFTRTWLFVGHVSQIPNPGDFIQSRMGEEQVIVTKDRQGKVHVLLNSCRHRGNMVCRYDQGHAFAFQCSFHGWVYNSSGQLVVLPPGAEQDYTSLNKAEWGLLEARVEVFHGSIWANWDHSAPGLIDFLGGAEVYLKDAFLDSEGLEESEEEGGVEILGGIMKWQLGMNWKVPMPDHDATHFWVTHRSQAVLGNFRDRVVVKRAGQSDYSVGMSDEQPQAGGGGRGGGRRGQMYSISFPEGHTTSLFWPEDLDAVPASSGGGGMYNSAYPAIQEYMKGKDEARRRNLGNKLVNINEGPHVFPNLGFFGRVARVLHPNGPDSTEMWSYFIVDKKAPPEVKEEYARQFETIYGPAGIVQKDDMENWYILTQYSKGTMTRRTRLNTQMGMNAPLHGPSTPSIGMPGLWVRDLTDENTRRFYRRWAEVMEAKDWNELRVESAK